jgi:hypothetical protein
MPYILGHKLSQQNLDTFIIGLTEWSDNINNMFNAANNRPAAMGGPPRGAYIGVRFIVDAKGNIQGNSFYGPSSLSLHKPVYRQIVSPYDQSIPIAYYNARKSANDAAAAVAVIEMVCIK